MRAYSLDKLTMLVVEDNRFMRNLVVELLRGLGATQIIEAPTGERAIEELRSYAVDLVITDIEMPDGDGLSLIQRIRTDDELNCRLVPIIALSASTHQTVVFAARDAGVTEFLAKPVSAAAIYKRICAIIEQPRQFVRADGYFGPDRRRRVEVYDGPDRRSRSGR